MNTSYSRQFVAIRVRTFAALLAATIALLFPSLLAGQGSYDQPEKPKVIHSSESMPAKGRDSAAQQRSYPGAPPQEEPSYPGTPGGKGKIEGTMGPLKVGFYGTLLLNIAVNDSVEIGQDVPLWPAGGDGTVTFPDGTTRRSGIVRDTIFTARQSILGFTFGQTKPSADAWTPSGVLEFDFFGTRPVDSLQPQGRVLNQPRLRLAYFQLEKGKYKIVAGQDKMIISPLDPISLSHVAVPLGATAGDLWGWLPQVRLDVTQKFGETSALFQVGVLRPLFGDPVFTAFSNLPTSGTSVDVASSGLGERSTQPFYQARVAVSHPFRGSTTTIGAGGHYGQERIGADRNLDSWAFALDYHIPIHPRLILRGEGFVGSNLAPFQGGVLQGAAVLQQAPPPPPAPQVAPPPDKINKIGAGGGWVELTVPITLDFKNILYFGAGTDDPRDRHLLAGSLRNAAGNQGPFSATGRSKNSFLWASYFRKLTNEVTLAFEWSNWDFQTRRFSPTGVLGPRNTSGRGNVFNLALAYQF